MENVNNVSFDDRSILVNDTDTEKNNSGKCQLWKFDDRSILVNDIDTEKNNSNMDCVI